MSGTRVVAAGLLLAALGGAPLRAGRGAGELHLDRAALAALAQAGMPRTAVVPVPGPGEMVLELEPPAHLELREGGVEGWVGVRAPDLEIAAQVHVRYVPGKDPISGVLRLEPVRAGPQGWPASLVAHLPPIVLPRGTDWVLPGVEGRAVRIRLHVQGLAVEEDRLVLQFGLLAREETSP